MSKVTSRGRGMAASGVDAPRTSITGFGRSCKTSASGDGPATMGTRSRPASIAASLMMVCHRSCLAPRATLRSA